MSERVASVALFAVLSCSNADEAGPGAESSSTAGSSGPSSSSATTDASTSTDAGTAADTSTAADAGTSTDTTDGGTALLRGGAQKGPLLLGSSVSATRLDAGGLPTDETFTGQLDDDRGRFELGEVPAGVYLLEADGFHYDEIRGALSGAPIVLRAVVSLPTDGDVYINAFTHLAHRRVLELLAAGESIDDAKAQAEQAVAMALPIGVATSAPAPGSAMTLLEGDDAAGRYLFATSVLLGQAAALAAAGQPSDAYLQQLLNDGAAQLGDAGQLDESTTLALLEGLLAIDVAAVEDHLAMRLLELGIDNAVPQLDLVLDQDRDEIVNDEDRCDLVADPAQLDADTDGIGDACDPYPIGDPEEIAGGIELPWSFVVTPE